MLERQAINDADLKAARLVWLIETAIEEFDEVLNQQENVPEGVSRAEHKLDALLHAARGEAASLSGTICELANCGKAVQS